MNTINTAEKFTKATLKKDSIYLLFGEDRKFVARFKYRGPVTMAKFIKELIANHTPEKYFAAMAAGKAPLDILRDHNPAWYDKMLRQYLPLTFSRRH